MKTIPTTDLPDSAFREIAGIPVPIDPDPTLPNDFRHLNGRDYVSPYTSADRCQCGAIVEGVDLSKLRVVTHGATETLPMRVYIVSCPMCPNRR